MVALFGHVELGVEGRDVGGGRVILRESKRRKKRKEERKEERNGWRKGNEN